MGCHQVDKTRVGPPFSAVAQRYMAGGQPMINYLPIAFARAGVVAGGPFPCRRSRR